MDQVRICARYSRIRSERNYFAGRILAPFCSIADLMNETWKKIVRNACSIWNNAVHPWTAIPRQPQYYYSINRASPFVGTEARTEMHNGSRSSKESPPAGVVISSVIFPQNSRPTPSFPSFCSEQRPDIALIRDSVMGGWDLHRRGWSVTDFSLNG